MDYPENTITILTNEEFLLLLAASGIEQWYGLDLTGQKESLEDERQLNTSLASLYQKGVVDWEDGRAAISAPYRPVFRLLRDSKVCILAANRSRPGYIRSYYCGGGSVVCVERRTASEKELEIEMKPVSGWLDELRASEVLPDAADIPADNAGLRSRGELCCSFELRTAPEGEFRLSMGVYEAGLYTTLEISDGEKTDLEDYRAEKVIDILKEWSGGAA